MDCPHHDITLSVLWLQIIIHPQAQLMRTNNIQCHLTAFFCKERKNSSLAGPGGSEMCRAKLTVLRPLAYFITSLRFSVDSIFLCSGSWERLWVRHGCQGEAPAPPFQSSVRSQISQFPWHLLVHTGPCPFTLLLPGVRIPPSIYLQGVSSGRRGQGCGVLISLQSSPRGWMRKNWFSALQEEGPGLGSGRGFGRENVGVGEALAVPSSPGGLTAILAPAGVSCQARARPVMWFNNWVKKA